MAKGWEGGGGIDEWVGNTSGHGDWYGGDSRV